MSNQEQDVDQSKVLKQRQEKALALKGEGLNLFPNTFRPQHHIGDLKVRFEQATAEELEGIEDRFVIAGRIMAKRDYGKSVFFDLMDYTGRMQAYVRKNDLPAERFSLFKKMDIGDFLGLEGRVFRTRTGELTLMANALELVTKSIRPLPEKYHEINVELRYRRRYLDLIMNDRVREVFVKRTRIIAALRRFLESRDFLEVETPMMQLIPGGATARPFETHHQALDMKLYLRIAPELYLKRLLVGGFERVFELNRNFRNEGISTQHNPEFTMLEFYQCYADYRELMDLTEEMFLTVAREVGGGGDPGLPGPGDSHGPALEKAALPGLPAPSGPGVRRGPRGPGAGPELLPGDGGRDAGAGETRQDSGQDFRPGRGTQVDRSDLHHPLSDRYQSFGQALRGRARVDGPFRAVHHRPGDGQRIFGTQRPPGPAGPFSGPGGRTGGRRRRGPVHGRGLRAGLKYGMPPAAGEGVGIDRLAMLLCDVATIKDVILFPHMRPER